MINIYPLTLNIWTLERLAQQIRFPVDLIYKILETKSSKVNIFTISTKRSDGTKKERDIYNPDFIYKKLLRNINKNLLHKANIPKGICGGVKGKSLSNMVEVHCGREAIYSIDLKDFYPSITPARVFKFFINSKCHPDVAEILTKLVTHDEHLPQGFPTSTMLANLIAYKLDVDQLNICEKFNLERTRWIDDIVFSGRVKKLSIAAEKIDCAVKYNGFKINKNKRKFTRRKNNPEAVGLLINRHKPYIPRGIIEKVKEILIIAKLHGPSMAKFIYDAENGKKNFKSSLKGKINYISYYNHLDAIELEVLFKETDWDKKVSDKI